MRKRYVMRKGEGEGGGKIDLGKVGRGGKGVRRVGVERKGRKVQKLGESDTLGGWMGRFGG